MSETGQSVVVTGAAQGIGAAIVHWFGSRGYHVIGIDSDIRAIENFDSPACGNVHWVHRDVRDTDAILGRIARYGRPPQILVNNAAVASPREFWAIERPDLEEIFGINVFAGLHLMQGVARGWIGHAVPGVVVNVTSVNAIRPVRGHLMYNATKAAMISMTQTAALELAPHGIRVNAVAPGSTQTAAWEDWPAATREHFASLSPMARLASPAEIANVVGFLAGPDSAYMTGACVVVDGGLTVGLPS